jgi:hypothetical protein
LRWLFLLAALAAVPILLHGCHGDEDHELVVSRLVSIHE